MPTLTISLEGDNAFADIPREKIIEGEVQRVTALTAGMQSGKPSVALLVALPDGRYVFAETSLALFLTAADALKARHGDPRQDDNARGGVQ